MWGKRKSEDKLEAQAIKLMVACSEITQDLKKLHSNEEMANIQTRNTEVATPWKAIPSSVRWRWFTEPWRGRVHNLLFFPLPLSSPAAEISSSVRTMVLSSIVFNTKGPTIAPMDLDVGLVEGGGVHFVPAWVMVFCLFLLG